MIWETDMLLTQVFSDKSMHDDSTISSDDQNNQHDSKSEQYLHHIWVMKFLNNIETKIIMQEFEKITKNMDEYIKNKNK